VAEPSLELLQAMMQRMIDRQEAMQLDLRELKLRMTSVEISLTNFAAAEASHYVSLAQRADRVDARLERIEQRLGLVEAWPAQIAHVAVQSVAETHRRMRPIQRLLWWAQQGSNLRPAD
jgi:hypothetical protein